MAVKEISLRPPSRRSSWLMRLLGLVISLAACIFILHTVDLGASADVLRRARPAPLALVVVFIAIQVSLRSWRWQILLASGATPARVPVRRIVGPMLVGYLANAVLPARLGEAVRAGVLSRRERLSFPTVLGTVVLERIVDTASMALLVALAATQVGAPAWLVGIGIFVFAASALIIVVLGTVGIEPLVGLAERVARVLPLAGLSARVLVPAERFARGIRVHDRRRATLAAAFFSGGCWFLEALNFWLIAQALGLGLSPAGGLLVAGITVLGTAVPAAPGYIGTFELAAITVAETLGVSPAQAVAYALLAHLMTIVPLIIGGAVSMVGLDLGISDLNASARPETSLPAEEESMT
jgi:uncharacterized protein (TIRG00374 family)